MQTKQTTPKWSEIKRGLKEWRRPEVIGLVQELFEYSEENRAFLAARLLREAGSIDPIQPYRRKILAAFSKTNADPDLAAARKAIRDYRKVSNDLGGMLELMLVYLEEGTRFTCEFGDMYAGYYDSLCSVLDDFARKLRAEDAREYLDQFRERLLRLAIKANGIGWGFGDYVCDTVAVLIDTTE